MNENNAVLNNPIWAIIAPQGKSFKAIYANPKDDNEETILPIMAVPPVIIPKKFWNNGFDLDKLATPFITSANVEANGTNADLFASPIATLNKSIEFDNLSSAICAVSV